MPAPRRPARPSRSPIATGCSSRPRCKRSTPPSRRCAASRMRRSEQGRDLDVFTAGVVTCRPTRKEAEEYDHYATVENADLGAIDHILAMRGVTPDKYSAEEFATLRRKQAYGMGGVRARRHAGRDRARHRRAEPSRDRRHRAVLRPLYRGAALFLRRGAAAARAARAAQSRFRRILLRAIVAAPGRARTCRIGARPRPP